MKTKQNKKYVFLTNYFLNTMPDAATELIYDNPFQLLVSVILSAQCTDKRINQITPHLFQTFPDAQSLSNANFQDVFNCIKSVSYPNNKAKHLIGMATLLHQKFNNEMPNTIEQLITMPGVGRKTANVITSVLFEQPNMAVDTHVFRLSHRIGLVKKTSKTTLLVEQELIQHIPQDLIHKAHHWLILHGRYVCKAKKPDCENCGLQKICNYYKTKFQHSKNQQIKIHNN